MPRENSTTRPNAIFKYPLPKDGGRFWVELPVGAHLLDIQPQHEWLQLWALVDRHAKTERVEFCLCGTGLLLDNLAGMRHLSTVQVGAFVFHVFTSQGVTP